MTQHFTEKISTSNAQSPAKINWIAFDKQYWVSYRVPVIQRYTNFSMSSPIIRTCDLQTMLAREKQALSTRKLRATARVVCVSISHQAAERNQRLSSFSSSESYTFLLFRPCFPSSFLPYDAEEDDIVGFFPLCLVGSRTLSQRLEALQDRKLAPLWPYACLTP